GCLPGFGDAACLHRGPSHALARRYCRHRTRLTPSLAHVLWMVYRHRFLLPGPATSIPGGIAQDKPADCASHPSTPVAGFLAGSSSLHQCVQEKIAGGRLRSVCTLKPDLVRRNDMSTAVLTNRLELS